MIVMAAEDIANLDLIVLKSVTACSETRLHIQTFISACTDKYWVISHGPYPMGHIPCC